MQFLTYAVTWKRRNVSEHAGTYCGMMYFAPFFFFLKTLYKSVLPFKIVGETSFCQSSVKNHSFKCPSLAEQVCNAVDASTTHFQSYTVLSAQMLNVSSN